MLKVASVHACVQLPAKERAKIDAAVAYVTALPSVDAIQILMIGNKVIVSFNNGTLRVYDKQSGECLSERANFFPGRVDQLAVDVEAETLLVRANGFIHLFSLAKWTLQETLKASKGASAFALSNATGKTAKLAVSVKRKLLLWDESYKLMDRDNAMPTAIKALAWVDPSHLLVASGSTGSVVNVNTSTLTEIPSPSEASKFAASGAYLGLSTTAPILLPLDDRQCLVSRERNAQIINVNGTEVHAFAWATPPHSVSLCPPFLISLHLPKRLEVRNVYSGTVLQSLQLPSALHLLGAESHKILAWGERNIWFLNMGQLSQQIEELMAANAYEEAISLLQASNEKRRVKLAYAGHHFQERHYKKAMDLFEECHASPQQVIRLFPENLEPNDKIPTDDLKPATEELRGFLISVRRKFKRILTTNGTIQDLDALSSDDLQAFAQDEQQFIAERDAEALPETAELVDTTLFQAYMQVSPSLIGPLLRLDNFCNAEIVEKRLVAAERYNELVDFFHSKELHRQALTILAERGSLDRVISYLQSLSSQYLPLILESARDALRQDPQAAMQIFLADSDNAKSLSRAPVVELLKQVDPSLAMTYLEHIIDEWRDMTAAFHDDLAAQYLQQRQFSRLQDFLQRSAAYSPSKIYPLMDREEPGLFETRCLILCKLGDHREALRILVLRMQKPALAESYCEELWRAEQTSVFPDLLQLYLSEQPVQWQAAMSLLTHYGARLPPDTVLGSIPASTSLHDLQGYFRGQLRETVAARRLEALQKNVYEAARVRVEETLCLGKRMDRVLITEDRVCGVCYKRFGGSAIKVMPE